MQAPHTLLGRGLVTGLTVVAFAGVASDSAAARGLRWSKPVRVDHGNTLTGIACPSKGLCVAGGFDGLFVSTDPTGGAAAWSRVLSPSVPGHKSPSVYQGSCPSTSFCAFPAYGGKVLTSTDPAGGPGAWKVAHNHLSARKAFESLSCASSSLCVAVVAGSRKIAVSKNPSGGSSAWHVRRLSSRADSVSCVRRLCVISAQNGNLLTSRHPATGHWRSRGVNGGIGRPGPLPFYPVACASSRYCVGASLFPIGSIFNSTHPTGGTGAWLTRVVIFPRKAFTGVSCTSSRFCAVAANDGSVYTARGKFKRRGDFRKSRTDRTRDQNVHISCASRHFCVIDRSDGKLFTARG